MLRLTRGSVSSDGSSGTVSRHGAGSPTDTIPGDSHPNSIHATQQGVQTGVDETHQCLTDDMDGLYVSNVESLSNRGGITTEGVDAETVSAAASDYATWCWEVEVVDQAYAGVNICQSDTSSVLDFAAATSVLLTLDLSWCGPYGAIFSSTFLEFIHKCGEQLVILRLGCCDFIDNYCLYMIANVCRNLTGEALWLDKYFYNNIQ